ncbi:MAG: SRPBCC domain-containing protein [Myxococcota bacterium]
MSDAGTEERLLHVPLERVFAAFTEPQYMKRWLGLEAFVDLKVGGAYELSWPDNGPGGTPEINGAIVELRPPEHLLVGWNGDSEGTLELHLEPTLGGTRVRLNVSDHPAWTAALDRLEAWLAGPRTR